MPPSGGFFYAKLKGTAMSSKVLPPYPLFNDIDGRALNAGYVYIGEAGKNPEVYPIPVFWDEALTVPAEQPIRTRNGFFAKNGRAGKVYVSNSECSITVKNRKHYIVYTDLLSDLFIGQTSGLKNVESISDLPAYAKNGDAVYVKGYYKPTNFALAQPYIGGGSRIYVASRKAENDGFLCINGWVLQHENVFTPYHSGCKCDGVTDDTLNFDKLMYALERNNLKGHVIINDPMFFNSQCPRIGKLIDPVQFNEKNAIRLVSNVKLEINSTLTFGSFYSGSSGQPKCNILSAMYRADADDWYGKNRHENIEVFGTGTLDFTATESESAVQDGYRWIIKASSKRYEGPRS